MQTHTIWIFKNYPMNDICWIHAFALCDFWNSWVFPPISVDTKYKTKEPDFFWPPAKFEKWWNFNFSWCSAPHQSFYSPRYTLTFFIFIWGVLWWGYAKGWNPLQPSLMQQFPRRDDKYRLRDLKSGQRDFSPLILTFSCAFTHRKTVSRILSYFILLLFREWVEVGKRLKTGTWKFVSYVTKTHLFSSQTNSKIRKMKNYYSVEGSNYMPQVFITFIAY